MVGGKEHNLILSGGESQSVDAVKLDLGVLRLLFTDLLLDHPITAAHVCIVEGFVGPDPTVLTSDN